MNLDNLWHILKNELEVIKKKSDFSHHKVLEQAFEAIKNSLENFLSEQVIAGLPHPHPRSRVYRSEPKTWNITDINSEQLLNLILNKASEKERPACVFDLDGTLFDVGYRTLGIIKEWLSTDNAKNFNKNLIKKVEKITYEHIGYSLSHAFENAGFNLLDLEITNLYSAIERTWKKKFFDGKSLLKYDQLIDKSNNFIHKLHNSGITILYLTGRHHDMMYDGTVEQLRKFSFPLDKKNLILKQSFFVDDQVFKAEKMKNMASKYDIISNFENEYLNLAYMSLEIPGAIHVIVDSQHSGRPTPELHPPIYRISSF